MSTPYWKPRDRYSKYDLNRLSGMNMKDAAIEAGFTPSTARTANSLFEPGSRIRIAEALEGAGATNPFLATAIHDALNADKAIVVDKTIQYVTDHRVRLDAVRLALEAKGELKTGNTVAVQINFPAGLAEMLAQDAEEYKAE
jgi:hypothetical protein